MDKETLDELCLMLGFGSSETFGSDLVDFTDVAVWQAREALRLAFELGRASEKGGDK